MRKIIFICLFLFSINIFSQESNFVFFTEKGELFTLSINNTIYNTEPKSEVKVEHLKRRSYLVKINFADTSLPGISDFIYLKKNMEETFVIKRVRKSFMENLLATRLFSSKPDSVIKNMKQKIDSTNWKYEFFFKEGIKIKPSDTTTTPQKYIAVSFCPTEMPFGYETGYLDYKFSKRFSLGIGIGHVFPNVLVDQVINAADPIWVAYHGTMLKLNFKYFIKNSNGVYFSLNATYKELSYGKHTWDITYSDYGASYITLSESAHIFGGGLILGRQRKIYKHVFLDLFIGIGVNNKIGNYTVQDLIIPDGMIRTYWHAGIRYLNPVGKYSENYFYPIFQAGIKIGFIHAKK